MTRVPAAFTESEVEDAALEWLESLGWRVLHGPSIGPDTAGAERTDYSEVILERSQYGSWQEYQRAAARAFRDLDCTAEVDKIITGARGTHKIDVFVTFQQFGNQCRWVVECKLWSKPVSKDVVQTLQSIVQNVGADRGIIFAEGGFQSGAHIAAQNTNILLHSSLEDFKHTAHVHTIRIPLSRQDSDEPDAPPVHVFHKAWRPHYLLRHEDRLLVGNWGIQQGGNIAIVDPVTRSVEGVIDLDKYETRRTPSAHPEIHQYSPGNMACADGRVFVGQVFSRFLLVIDIRTQSIVRRIAIPGGGEGSIASSPDGKHIYFASNRANRLFIVDSATYEYETVDYPRGGRGSLCVLPHPSKPLLYIGMQRGGALYGASYPGGNCFLATYDLARHRYINTLYLAEIRGNRSDDSAPVCLTYDEKQNCLFVGMFQSLRGICRVDETGSQIMSNVRLEPNARNEHFRWVDPLSQALYRNMLITVNRNNRELVVLDRRSGRVKHTAYLGDAPNGPHSVVVVDDMAVISYPERGGLVFYDLGALG